MNRAICKDCDLPLAYDADLDACPCTGDGRGCPTCSRLCWLNFNPACTNVPIDWRARALAAEAALAAAGATPPPVPDPYVSCGKVMVGLTYDDLGTILFWGSEVNGRRTHPELTRKLDTACGLAPFAGVAS